MLYILCDDWPIFMISGSNDQLQQELEYTLLKPDCHRWWISKIQSGSEDTLEERYSIKFCWKCHAMKAGSTAMTQRPRDSVPSGSILALPDPRRPDRANPPTNFWWSLFWQHWHNLHALDPHWTDSQQGILCWVFKGVQKEIPSEEANTNRVSGISTRTIHQSTTPSLSQTIWPRWASRHFLTLPIVQTLLPGDFCLFPKLRGCRYETIEEMKEAVTKSLTRTHKRNPWGLPEVVGTDNSALQLEEITSKGTWVSCVYYQ